MSEARCHVFTEKEGLLSKVAHDLRIRVDRCDVTVSGEGEARSVTATFDPASLVVETALAKGADKPGALSAGDIEKIETTIRKDVLVVRKHPEIAFRSTRVEDTGSGIRVTGDLSLFGKTRSITVSARDVGDAWESTVNLHQPDWGIKPYRAALGALKIKSDVRVELHIPKK